MFRSKIELLIASYRDWNPGLNYLNFWWDLNDLLYWCPYPSSPPDIWVTLLCRRRNHPGFCMCASVLNWSLLVTVSWFWSLTVTMSPNKCLGFSLVLAINDQFVLARIFSLHWIGDTLFNRWMIILENKKTWWQVRSVLSRFLLRPKLCLWHMDKEERSFYLISHHLRRVFSHYCQKQDT